MMTTRIWAIIFSAVSILALAVAIPAFAQEQSQPKAGNESPPRFGSPDQVDNRIEADESSISRTIKERVFQPYFNWKKSINEDYGLAFGLDYSGVYLNASDNPSDAEDSAGSGIGRFYGSWEMVGRESGNTGAFVWKMEHRHKYTDIPASAFGFNLGYAGLIEAPFSDQGFRWTNLYWRQSLNEKRITLLGGFLDATDYVDVYALASPWTGFLNFAFSTGTLTMPLPNDAALGAAAGAMVTDNFFLIGGLVDRNADPTEPFEGFDTFFSDNEYFKSIEIGYTPSQDRIYLDNVHLTLWHADERAKAGEPDGWGINFSYSSYLAEKWMPFVRAGYADDGGSLMQKSVSTGVGYQPIPGADLIGIGLNWGEPNEDTFGKGLRDQYTAEVFYRWQLAPQVAITPNLQWLRNPALNPDEDQIWILGLRARLAL